jgi:hypothetical protein
MVLSQHVGAYLGTQAVNEGKLGLVIGEVRNSRGEIQEFVNVILDRSSLAEGTEGISGVEVVVGVGVTRREGSHQLGVSLGMSMRRHSRGSIVKKC